MPTVLQLRKNLEKAVDDSVTPIDSLSWFNSALRDLATVARIPGKAVITIPADTSTVEEVSLPTDIVELKEIKVEFSDGRKFNIEDLAVAYGLKIYDNTTIEWDPSANLPAGRFVVRYHRYPTPLIADADIPEIPEIFHDALTYFAAREYYMTDDEIELANGKDEKYLILKSELDTNAKNRGTTSTPKIMDVRPRWAR